MDMKETMDKVHERSGCLRIFATLRVEFFRICLANALGKLFLNQLLLLLAIAALS